jgi:hypothetical protein
MPFATWWRGDPLPALPPLPSFSARASIDTQSIAQLANLSPQTVDARMRRGNHPYIACLDESPVAYGWMATREGAIIELDFSF